MFSSSYPIVASTGGGASAWHVIEHAVDQVVQQRPQFFGLDFVGDLLGPLLVLLDQAAGFLEDAGFFVELADAGQS